MGSYSSQGNPQPCYPRQFFFQPATQRWWIKNLLSCRGGVTRLHLFSQLATHTITNKMTDTLSHRHLEPWLAHSDKIALQVAEGMLHASNLAHNIVKSRGLFYFSCNWIAVPKWGARREFFLATCNATWTFSCNLQRNVNFFLQIATQRLLRCKLQEKLLRVTWP